MTVTDARQLQLLMQCVIESQTITGDERAELLALFVIPTTPTPVPIGVDPVDPIRQSRNCSLRLRIARIAFSATLTIPLLRRFELAAWNWKMDAFNKSRGASNEVNQTW